MHSITVTTSFFFFTEEIFLILKVKKMKLWLFMHNEI